MLILNTIWKDHKSRKNLRTKIFTFKKKFYEHKIAAVNLSKHNRDLNRDLNTIQFWWLIRIVPKFRF